MMSGWPEGAAESACCSADVPKGLRAVCLFTRPFHSVRCKEDKGGGGAGEPDKVGEDGKCANIMRTKKLRTKKEESQEIQDYM